MCYLIIGILRVFVYGLSSFWSLLVTLTEKRSHAIQSRSNKNTHVRSVVVHVSIRIEKINSSGLWLTNPVVCVRAAVVVN